MRAQNLLQYEPAKKIMWLDYGNSGVGKSVFASSSRSFKTLVFDIDSGMTSPLRIHGASHGHLIDVVEIKNWKTFFADISVASNFNSYGLIVIDTVTELAKMLLHEIVGQGIAQRQHWGQLLIALEALARLLRTFPQHVMWLAHESIDMDSGTRLFKPNFQGQFSKEFAKHFDVITRHFVMDLVSVDPTTGGSETITQRWMNCWRDEYTTAKDRFVCLQKYEQPDLGLDYFIQRFSYALSSMSAGQYSHILNQ